ncbi:Uncharacterized damage-inducible protein DinB (forms a four-helix bundle) [Nocardioides terrae]|uniref:Uncharacterized damage-inducible protein DinB (Forms a four-helix bundle) n=1 Tax=Nocardioides terrae TaxID=574651 RepID=A0A1I1N421_9ACTN|nr:DinB family protein [Nocardioides terrae]SFC92401.1 Uncharacterized damage-inducible protein DinB (forms a four-helix bundle) [Nocardioides terrae]
MTPSDLLKDAYTRVVESAESVVDGLSEDQLAARPAPDANPIAWLVWHLARVQDDHVAEVAGTEQVWTSQGYADRFGLPFDVGATGYGQTSEQVGRVRASADLLSAYVRSVHEQTLAFLATLSEEDLDRVVDRRWNPPVTLGARLVSVVNDDTQHVGQAAYVKGLLGQAPRS